MMGSRMTRMPKEAGRCAAWLSFTFPDRAKFLKRLVNLLLCSQAAVQEGSFVHSFETTNEVEITVLRK